MDTLPAKKVEDAFETGTKYTRRIQTAARKQAIAIIIVAIVIAVREAYIRKII